MHRSEYALEDGVGAVVSAFRLVFIGGLLVHITQAGSCTVSCCHLRQQILLHIVTFHPGVSLHTVKFELTSKHSVGGKDRGALTDVTQMLWFYSSVSFKLTTFPYFNSLKGTTVSIYMDWITEEIEFFKMEDFTD